MSRTVHVLPSRPGAPTFAQVVGAGTRRMQRYFDDFGFGPVPELAVTLFRKRAQLEPPDLDLGHPARDALFEWDSPTYAWIYAPFGRGGTDVWRNPLSAEERDIWLEDLRTHPAAPRWSAQVTAWLDAGWSCYFRRSAGQPAFVNVLYGFLAAGLAELTRGLVYSDDGAWDCPDLVLDPDSFCEVYFRPGAVSDTSEREYVADCIAALPAELDEIRRGPTGSRWQWPR